jgi:hypothetical protein
MKSFHIYENLAEYCLQWEMFQTKLVEYIKTHFIFSNFFFEIRAIYEKMWKHMVNPERRQTIWRICVACWISKATRTLAHAHTEKYIRLYFFSTATMASWTCLIVALHVHRLASFHSNQSSPRTATQTTTFFSQIHFNWSFTKHPTI